MLRGKIDVVDCFLCVFKKAQRFTMHSVAAVHYNATEARLQPDHLEQSYQQKPRKRSVGFQGRPNDDQQAFCGDNEAVSSGIVHHTQSEVVEPSNKIHSDHQSHSEK